jgi:tetratricopeptide (TPR) repeat protein
VNLLTYDRNQMHLADELKKRKEECDSWRRKWRLQPKIKPTARGPEGGIQPREGFADPLFSPETLANDPMIRQIDEALKSRAKRSRDTGSGVLVAIIGPAGSGKLLKACQFAEAKKGKYDPLIFHAYNNDDVYSYIKRIREATSEHVKERIENENKNASNASDRQDAEADLRPVLVVINDVDKILGAEPRKPWSPRNFAARGFLGQLLSLESKLKKDSSVKGTDVNIHVLITARALPAPAEAELMHAADGAGEDDWRIEVKHPEEQPFYSGHSVGLDNEDEFRLLAWETRKDYSGLILGATWINDTGTTVEGRAPQEKLEELVRALRSNSTEIGTRVVRHIVRDLDRAERGAGRKYETLLAFLSCFNTPISKSVFDATLKCCIEHFGQADFKHQTPGGFNDDPLRHLLRLGLVQAVGPFGKTQQCPGDADVNYIVIPLVKRYFHQVIDRAPALSEMPGCGVHGLLSRGPFNSPGSSNKARTLFRHFAKLAADGVESYIHAQNSMLKENPPYTTHYIRAMIDILRSNFACNSVPSWGGKFRDYVDMLTITIDLLRNYAVATNEYWEPGRSNLTSPELSPCFSELGVASAEEMLHLYNELGLAYYNIGSVQDALNVWELAFDWQRAVPMTDSNQGKMYAASLNSHLGMAYLQLGRMQLAVGCFEKARADARDTGNLDLESRMVGMLGRVDHFRGNVDEARKTYLAVIEQLGEAGNLRAKSYFMRHLAALYARLGDFEPARRLARESKAIAASQNAPDLVAFSSELEGRVLSAAGEHQKAIRAYHVALEEARPLDIARLNADIKLGLANLQLRLGDASSARNLAIEVMVLANENLLVLRQAKALLVIGKAAVSFGENGLARSTLMHAKQLASDAGFQLVKHEAEEALVGMKVGAQEQAEAVP